MKDAVAANRKWPNHNKREDPAGFFPFGSSLFDQFIRTKHTASSQMLKASYFFTSYEISSTIAPVGGWINSTEKMELRKIELTQDWPLATPFFTLVEVGRAGLKV